MACLRKILGVTRVDKLRNSKIRDKLSYHEDLIFIIKSKKLKYFRHIMKIKYSRYPKILLEGNIQVLTQRKTKQEMA